MVNGRNALALHSRVFIECGCFFFFLIKYSLICSSDELVMRDRHIEPS